MKYQNVPGIRILEASVNDSFTPFTHTASGNNQLIVQPGTQNVTVDFAVINYDLLSNNRYYYRDGYLYSVDPRTRLVESVIQALIR